MPAPTSQTPSSTPVAKGRQTTATPSPQRSTRTLPGGAGVIGRPTILLSPQPVVSEDGKRMFRTRDGKLVELPPDITYEEAARLEAEARAAEAKLGKGPPPKPVPDVKKLAKKEEKKEKPKPGAKSKKDGRGKGKAAPRAGGAGAAQLKVGPGKVAQYLAAKGLPVLLKGLGRLQKLRQNEQTHDDAAEKRQQSEKAVVIPLSDGQSKSNTGQVTTVSGRPAPTVDENKGKQKLQESLKENIPQSIEDVDNFKRDKKAQHTGADVMKIVQGDKNAVTATFADMEQTPPPAPPEHTPEALPPPEMAPPTAALNLGQGAIAPLQKEHTDLSNYTKEADSKLKEEGVTQEQLDMVDSGDLAAANKEKKGMETAAKNEPLAVQKFARQETEKIDKDLQQEEKKERASLKAKRTAGLGATAQKQKGTKSALEEKREAVATKINGIFKAAQDKVKKKLGDLETQSLKRFDDGNAQATKEFEDNVKSELDAFKGERYSGWFGWARRAKDWLLGMDDLPEVKAIFERNRSAFVTKVNKLVEDISADNKRVIQECKDELERVKKEIQDYVDRLGPDLKDIGQQAATEMNAKLNELDRFVAKKEQELQDKLKDKQQAAIKAIDEKIEKMKEAMSGALSKLGKLLLLAAKKFFTWALEKFGFSLSDIESIINKGAAVLKAIFTQPIRFVKNLVNAASTGFKNFGKNFLKHLKDAIFEWLTGSLQGVILPQTWDLKGVLSVVFQMLGLTYQNIRAHLLKLIPEPAVKTLETTFTLVRTLITQGPIAAWEQLKEIAGEIQKAFIEAVKDWIKWKVVEEAIKTVLAMFIPGAGIIRAIIGIYDTIVFFIQKAKDILKMVGNFLGSIAEIAAGNIGAAAEALENGLARALKLLIDFLARFLRLSGITKKIQEVIQTLRGKVDNVIARVAKWIVDKGKFLFAKGVGAVKAGVAAVVQWWRARFQFTAEDGQTHKLYFQGSESAAQLMVATTPVTVDAFLAEAQTRADALTDATEKAKRYAAIREARATIAELNRLTYRTGGAPPPNLSIEERAVNGLLNRLSQKLRILLRDVTTADRPVPRMVVVPGFSSSKASQLNVTYLFNGPGNHRPGTPADDYSGDLSGADTILRRMGVREDWVAFHILNDNTGGLAVDSNLIPTSRDINGEYSRGFEETHLKADHDAVNPTTSLPDRVIWMEARFNYRTGEGFPEFVHTYTARGGRMKYAQAKNIWERDKSADYPTFSRIIPLPTSPAIFINRLPMGAAPADARLRSLAIRETAFTANTMELIARWRRNHGVPFVGNQETLLRFYRWAVDEYDSSRSAGVRANDLYGINNANIDYSY